MVAARAFPFPMPPLDSPPVLRLYNDAWSMFKGLRRATNEYPPPPFGFPPPSLTCMKPKISRSKLYLIDLVDTASNIEALQDTQEVVGQSSLEIEPFGYSEIFVFTEQFLVMYRELILNFVLALIAVGVLSVFILGKLGIVALVCLTVVRLLDFRFDANDMHVFVPGKLPIVITACLSPWYGFLFRRFQVVYFRFFVFPRIR